MRPHHHEPKEAEKYCVKYGAHSFEIIISTFETKTLMPDSKVYRHEILEYKE